MAALTQLAAIQNLISNFLSQAPVEDALLAAVSSDEVAPHLLDPLAKRGKNETARCVHMRLAGPRWALRNGVLCIETVSGECGARM